MKTENKLQTLPSKSEVAPHHVVKVDERVVHGHNLDILVLQSSAQHNATDAAKTEGEERGKKKAV
jgi:hypothetical protein